MNHRTTKIAGGTRIELWDGAEPVPYGAVVDAWCADTSFVTWFNSLLGNSSLDAYRWETPPVSKATLDRPFEFVLIEAPELKQPATRASFSEHFEASPRADAVVFSNLGRDAVLVVPAPLGDEASYAHLSAFVRGAAASQQLALWKAVGEAMKKRISDRPVWLSTAGAGVAWLHVRLDDRPKYYHHEPYRGRLK